MNDVVIQDMAKQISIDLNAFTVCLSAPKTQQWIKEETANAKSMGVQESPSLFLNREKVNSVDELSALIRVQLSEK